MMRKKILHYCGIYHFAWDTTASFNHDIDGISCSWGGVLQVLQFNSLN